ncbi:flavin reductase (DIM6/NTAB) family NADH-FMN oxidoreductase RutF [Blastococcus colisei]|uniref:Flavin reductase (DIM6/NTAB) family NADH-FMN oxidoreductase RutF n=1 Tax=Blastococcus colisei TaxID=1564162 RepID=A0A543PIS0_9ACTN|nr:flavin reductase family protein [Blastococcus colisei]TQN43975.1 flavin reductase (DIM6/NTAB) family NADH-FMN oxidoreductase RutF [Blastococcus colisei]
MPVDAADFAAALGQYAAGVCLLTVRDGIDDVGTTVSSVMSVSAAPPLVAVGLSAQGYPAEVLEEVGTCGLTVLAAQHAIVASRFASAGRPSARHLLESVPWSRAPGSDAIVLDDGLAALDCRLERLVEAGDHVVALLAVEAVPVLDADARPLLRLRGRYVDESGSPRPRA